MISYKNKKTFSNIEYWDEELDSLCSGKWNDHYIKASSEAYSLLINDGYKPRIGTTFTDQHDRYLIKNCIITPIHHKNEYAHQPYKELYVIDGALSDKSPSETSKRK